MLKNSDLGSFNDLSAELNNENSFLFAISEPLINYLIYNNENIEEQLSDVCGRNRRFATNTLPYEISDKTVGLLENIFFCYDCACNNYKSLQEFEPIAREYVREYCIALCSLLASRRAAFEKKVCDMHPAFFEDFQATKELAVTSIADLIAAEKSLVFWHGAVPDVVLQEALVHMRYAYIKKLS